RSGSHSWHPASWSAASSSSTTRPGETSSSPRGDCLTGCARTASRHGATPPAPCAATGSRTSLTPSASTSRPPSETVKLSDPAAGQEQRADGSRSSDASNRQGEPIRQASTWESDVLTVSDGPIGSDWPEGTIGADANPTA